VLKTSPEQSKPDLVVPAYLYGAPRFLDADSIICSASLLLRLVETDVDLQEVKINAIRIRKSNGFKNFILRIQIGNN
jgi:hypothetical protein